MKKVLSMLVVFVMVFGLVACGGGSSEAPDRLEQIKEKGYIELAIEPYSAPAGFIDPTKEGDAQYVGADMELAYYIADKIGVELKIVPLEWTAVLVGISEGLYDFAISAISYSPEREESMNLSDGYYFGGAEAGGYGWIMRPEDIDKYKTVEDLKDAIVITQSGTIQEFIMNEYVPEAKEFRLLPMMTDSYIAVAEGMADVCITDKSTANLYVEANGNLVVSDYSFEVDPRLSSIVVAMPLEGTDSLEAVVNECIAELRAEGQIDKWFDEYSDYAKKLGL